MKYEGSKHNIIGSIQNQNLVNHRKIVRYGIGIFLLETFFIGLWFYLAKPESDVALDIFPTVFLLLAVNLVLGLLSYSFKKVFSSLFFANALICPLIFYAAWIMWFLFYAQYPS